MTSTADFTGTRTLDVAPEAIAEGSMFADRYAIEGRIGAGAQSIVYSALDMLVSPPRRVALKIARSAETNLSQEFQFLTRIHRDGEVAGVVRLVEPSLGEFDGTTYLVLEHIDGPTLRAAGLSSSEICRLGRRIAHSLASIHKADLIFADIKPENILLRDGFEPILVDFGAAREIQDSHSPILLTPAYAAPEQLAGQPPTAASDIYALALVLEELFQSRAPRNLVKILERARLTSPANRPSAIEFSRALETAGVLTATRSFRGQVVAIAGIVIILLATVPLLLKGNDEKPRASMVRLEKPSLSLISAPGKVQYLALGETHIYWTDGDGRTVFRASLQSGAPETVTQLENPAHQIAVSGQTIFIRSPGEIWSLANGKLKRLAESTGRGGVVADARFVAWTNEDTGEVVMANVDDDAPFRVVASGQAKPYSIAMDATHVYWANEGDGTISRVLREAGSVEVLARGQSWPASIVLDETYLYWLDRTVGFIMRQAKSGGEPQVVVKTSFGSWSMMVDATHVYWTSTEDGRVVRAAKTNGSPEVLAIGQHRPFGIVGRGNQLYFSNYATGGGVIRFCLP